MNQIKPYPLWLGHAGDLRDFRSALDEGIQALVELSREEPPTEPPREFIHCRFPLIDGDDNAPEVLRLAILTLTQLLEQKFACLVCCQAGLRRSVGRQPSHRVTHM